MFSVWIQAKVTWPFAVRHSVRWQESVVEKVLYLRIGHRDGLETITSKAHSRVSFSSRLYLLKSLESLGTAPSAADQAFNTRVCGNIC